MEISLRSSFFSFKFTKTYLGHVFPRAEAPLSFVLLFDQAGHLICLITVSNAVDVVQLRTTVQNRNRFFFFFKFFFFKF